MKTYKEKVERKIEGIENCETPQEKLDKLVEACHESVFEAAPKPKKTKKSSNPEIIKLSSQAKRS